MALVGALFLGPLSLVMVNSSERAGVVKGALFLRGLRTLDNPGPFRRIKRKGKGAGGLRGLCPLAGFGAAPRPSAAGGRGRATGAAQCSCRHPLDSLTLSPLSCRSPSLPRRR